MTTPYPETAEPAVLGELGCCACDVPPEVNPSLWFVGDAGPEWGVIRAARFPENEAPRPANFATIQQTFKARGFKGHFASVAFADSRQADASSAEPMPLYRGYGMYVAYAGLEGE